MCQTLLGIPFSVGISLVLACTFALEVLCLRPHFVKNQNLGSKLGFSKIKCAAIAQQLCKTILEPWNNEKPNRPSNGQAAIVSNPSVVTHWDGCTSLKLTYNHPNVLQWLPVRFEPVRCNTLGCLYVSQVDVQPSQCVTMAACLFRRHHPRKRRTWRSNRLARILKKNVRKKPKKRPKSKKNGSPRRHAKRARKLARGLFWRPFWLFWGPIRTQILEMRFFWARIAGQIWAHCLVRPCCAVCRPASFILDVFSNFLT